MTTEPRLPLSVCLIAGAEAASIRRALDSVAGWTAEIIVVINDDVTDGTGEIAAGCGARVFREPWKGHIAQKNSAAQKAGSDWILGLDADEVVSPELRVELEQLFAAPARLQAFAAFNFPRCTFYCGRWIRHGDWYPDRKVRLWRRGQAAWGGVDPHDKIQVTGAVQKLKGDLLHYPSAPDPFNLDKMVRYADLFAQQCVQQRRSVGAADLLLRPLWRFVRCYLLRRGFLDGRQGCYVAWLGAFYTFLRYAKAREQQRKAPASV